MRHEIYDIANRCGERSNGEITFMRRQFAWYSRMVRGLDDDDMQKSVTKNTQHAYGSLSTAIKS